VDLLGLEVSSLYSLSPYPRCRPGCFLLKVGLRNQSFECQELLRDLQVSDDIWSTHRGASAADTGERMTRSHSQRSQFTRV
jgi:hypothetical protein